MISGFLEGVQFVLGGVLGCLAILLIGPIIAVIIMAGALVYVQGHPRPPAIASHIGVVHRHEANAVGRERTYRP